MAVLTDLDVVYDNKAYGNIIDPTQWNANFKIIEEVVNENNDEIESHFADTENPHTVTKTQVGLGNVDNVQQATKSEFNEFVARTDNPHGVTSEQVGAYSKTQVETSGSAAIHWGNLTNVPNLADDGWKAAVANQAALPTTGNSLGDQRVVLDDGDGKQAVYLCVAVTGTIDAQWDKIGDVDFAGDEATRVTQESARVIAEGLRGTAETSRTGVESARVSAESGRSSAEGLRVTAETNRGSAEGLRVTAETGRSNAEINRVTAEGLRGTAETGRNSAEGLRVTAEGLRVIAENSRNLFGDYVAETSYVVGNKVVYNGSSYICILASIGNLPTNATYWKLIAAKGLDGTGSGDMSKSVYDTNGNDIVDNAEKVGGFTVGVDVPSYAAFTDTHVLYVIGTQTTTTSSWTGVATELEALTHGTTVQYWLPRTSASNATLNLTLKGGSTTGAINCYFTGTTRVGTQYAAGSLVTMIYLVDALITGTPYTGWFVSSYINTVYTHPTTAGNKHIPTGGTVGQIMTNSASGTAVWGDPVAGVTIVNGLTETVAGKALDATQGKILNDKIDERTQESCIVTVSTDDSQAVDGQIITLTNVTKSTTETYTLGIGETAHTFKITQNQVYKVKVDGKGSSTYVTPPETAEFAAIVSNIRNVAMVYEKIYRYGFRRTKSESNPATRITYLYDAVGKTPAYMNFTSGEFDYGDWEDFVEEVSRPVMLKTDGTVDYELSRTDFTKKSDGVTASDVSTTAYDGNAMIEFSKWKWVQRDEDATYEYVTFSNACYNSTYETYAHENALGTVNDSFYWGAFKGCNVGSKLRSLAGQTIMVSQTRNTEVSYATAIGTGYYTIYKSGWDYINDLLTLISKTDNAQTAFGQGRHGAPNALATGTLKDKPMFMGYDNATSDIKVFGIEGFWGNVFEGLAGLIFNTKIKVKMTPPYSFDGAGYIDTDIIPSGTSGGYVSSASVTSEAGYVPKVASGSATQYYCDGLWFNNSQVDYAIVGGNWDSGLLDGPRAVRLNRLASDVYAYAGSRLSFLDPA